MSMNKVKVKMLINLFNINSIKNFILEILQNCTFYTLLNGQVKNSVLKTNFKVINMCIPNLILIYYHI